MSLLYECINGIIQGGILDGEEDLRERDEVATLCVGKLRGMIVIDSDPNREPPLICPIPVTLSDFWTENEQSNTLHFLR